MDWYFDDDVVMWTLVIARGHEQYWFHLEALLEFIFKL